MPAREALEGTIADATAVAESTGLPPQTAKWTAFASLQSGVFTRAQVRAWLGAGSEKTRRTVAARIVKALLENELAAEYEVAGIGKCVQIQAKRIYRALGEPENRNRRKPGRQLAIERLLTLDYVLDHPGEAWLPTEAAKTTACAESGIPEEAWPRRQYAGKDGASTTRYFVEKYPVAIDSKRKRAALVCVSAAAQTTQGLRTWLASYEALIEELGRAGFAIELVHASEKVDLEEQARKDLAAAAAKLDVRGADDEATLERIRGAVRACTEESLTSIGGLPEGLRTVREIQARRLRGPAPGARIETRAWTSARLRGEARQSL